VLPQTTLHSPARNTYINEEYQILDKLKAMNLRVNDLAMKIKKAEKELKQMKESK
jgi:hypothetical protein